MDSSGRRRRHLRLNPARPESAPTAGVTVSSRRGAPGTSRHTAHRRTSGGGTFAADKPFGSCCVQSVVALPRSGYRRHVAFWVVVGAALPLGAGARHLQATFLPFSSSLCKVLRYCDVRNVPGCTTPTPRTAVAAFGTGHMCRKVDFDEMFQTPQLQRRRLLGIRWATQRGWRSPLSTRNDSLDLANAWKRADAQFVWFSGHLGRCPRVVFFHLGAQP